MMSTLKLGKGSRVGILYCSSELNSLYQVAEVKKYLEQNQVVVTEYPFTDANDLQAIVTNAASNESAIYVPTDNVVASNTGIIDNVCAPLNIPVFAGEESTCKGCGYATLAISYYSIGYKTGEMAAEVLLGQKDISTMPIAYDQQPVKKYVKSRCDALGIDTAALDALGYTSIEE